MLASIQIYVDLEGNPKFKNIKNVKDISTSLQGGFKALGERIKKDYTPIVTEVYNYTEKIDVDWNIAFQKYTVMKEAIVGKKGLCYYLERSVERGETTIRKERTRAA